MDWRLDLPAGRQGFKIGDWRLEIFEVLIEYRISNKEC